jgi:hypothetical protein
MQNDILENQSYSRIQTMGVRASANMADDYGYRS